MSRSPFLLLVVSLVSFGAVACAAEPAAETAASEAALVQQTRLDRVTPAEIASAHARSLQKDIQRCVAGNPAIVAVDAGNLGAFYRPGVDSYWAVKSAVEGMLAEPGVTSIPVATLAAAVEPWATRVLSSSVDADGFYVRPAGDTLRFYEAEMATREAKALGLAMLPGGKSLAEIRAQWAEVQSAAGTLDSYWLNPVKVAGEPDLADVRKAMNMHIAMHFSAWGNDAVDSFYETHEGPAEAPEFEPIRTFLKTSAIKKRWFFEGGGDEWSHHYLVVLDEHDQLWGMSMGYSE
jgi:hypothetical protein